MCEIIKQKKKKDGTATDRTVLEGGKIKRERRTHDGPTDENTQHDGSVVETGVGLATQSGPKYIPHTLKLVRETKERLRETHPPYGMPVFRVLLDGIQV